MTYTKNQSNKQQILKHFQMCESNFYDNLKNRVNIVEHAQKLYLKSTRYEAWDTNDFDIVGGGATCWTHCSLRKYRMGIYNKC